MRTLGTHNLDEKLVQSLLRKKRSYVRKSKGYYAQRDNLYELIWKQLGPELNAFPYIWKSRTPLEYDEAKSLIFKGILKAVDLYNPFKRSKCKFSSFLWTVVGQQLKLHDVYWKAEKRNPFKVRSLDEDMRTQYDDPPITLGGTLGVLLSDRSDFIKEFYYKHSFEQIVRKASPLQKKILNLAQEKRNHNQIFVALNCTRRKFTSELTKLQELIKELL